MVLLFTGCKEQKPTLHLYVWSDYIRPDLISQFEKEYNCRVVLDTYDTNEGMYTKLLFGAQGYDLLFPSTYYVDLLAKRKMIKVLDRSKVPNRENVNWDQLRRWGLKESNYSIPYMVSFSGLAYRSDRVEKPISWDIFSNKSLKGRMTLLNDPRETLGAALRFHGASVNSTSPELIEIAKEQVIAWKQQCAKFESEQYKNGIGSAEFLVCHGYSSDILQVAREIKQVGFSYPKEGSVAACDAAVIPINAPNETLAYCFINFLLRPEVAKENMIATCGYCPNKKALDMMTLEERLEGLRYPNEEVLPEFIRDLPTSNALYMEAWDTIKSS
jgi:spermidine/putrescine transport system substrate-binding protein